MKRVAAFLSSLRLPRFANIREFFRTEDKIYLSRVAELTVVSYRCISAPFRRQIHRGGRDFAVVPLDAFLLIDTPSQRSS